ncbi:KamA family radical SAM protein [Patescibacteria group bacterium]
MPVNVITNIKQLPCFLNFSDEQKKVLEYVIKEHALKITPHYASLIDWDNPKDPLLKMIVPGKLELDQLGFLDTSGESQNTKIRGLQHKYDQTVLILTTSNCAAFCRFCFRKRMVGKNTFEIAQDFKKIITYIKKHKEINNVLLSGGDVMTLPTNNILKILKDISVLPNIRNIRMGTRILTYLPQRIIKDKKLLTGLSKFSKLEKRLCVVAHFNHPKEISKQTIKAVDLLLSRGIILLNQAVLLKGVNDDPKVLAELFTQLSAIGIRPYYLFQARPVKSETHFQVEIEKGIKICDEAKKRCSGLSKTFRYICSHKSGKIEIIGKHKNKVIFKRHQAKNPKDINKIIFVKPNPQAKWFDDYK